MTPRRLKSFFASVAFLAWCLGQEPGLQIIAPSPGFKGDGPSRA
jgi:hypothetical protein